ncbi:hypothetical protein KL86PLE_10003 [uncultured Pleomorphomonas sp.]|uniref:Uncharacterized protein n=1 Tax=uncultured Pleomorphomonas sp. TaxID=442121 RepID=A0A212KXI5_9HYPH|nr:hypothetical protein KL86PLE_10003 [uncultured Pleomorphomonas sp.]
MVPFHGCRPGTATKLTNERSGGWDPNTNAIIGERLDQLEVAATGKEVRPVRSRPLQEFRGFVRIAYEEVFALDKPMLMVMKRPAGRALGPLVNLIHHGERDSGLARIPRERSGRPALRRDAPHRREYGAQLGQPALQAVGTAREIHVYRYRYARHDRPHAVHARHASELRDTISTG